MRLAPISPARPFGSNIGNLSSRNSQTFSAATNDAVIARGSREEGGNTCFQPDWLGVLFGLGLGHPIGRILRCSSYWGICLIKVVDYAHDAPLCLIWKNFYESDGGSSAGRSVLVGFIHSNIIQTRVER